MNFSSPGPSKTLIDFLMRSYGVISRWSSPSQQQTPMIAAGPCISSNVAVHHQWRPVSIPLPSVNIRLRGLALWGDGVSTLWANKSIHSSMGEFCCLASVCGTWSSLDQFCKHGSGAAPRHNRKSGEEPIARQ